MILLNGQPASSVDAFDRGLHYGDGLFETIAVRDGVPLLWERHMARLQDGCRRLGIALPDLAVLREEARFVVNENRAVLKIVVTRGAGGRGYRPAPDLQSTRLVIGLPWPEYPDAYQRTGVEVRLCQTRLSRNPALAGLKHLNRLEQVLARNEWRDENIAEGVMLDTEGHLVEGTMTNLFLVQGDTLLTPALGECGVEGVMRAQIIDMAGVQGIGCEVGTVSLHAAQLADAMFVTNSLIGLWPVRRFEERNYDDNPLVRRLQESLRQNHVCA